MGSKGSPFAVGTTSHRSLATSPRPVTRLLRRSLWSTTSHVAWRETKDARRCAVFHAPWVAQSTSDI